MLVEKSIEKGVGIITIDHPPVNALSPQVVEELIAAFEELHGDQQIRSIVVTAKGRTFVAGADVRQFQKMIEDQKVDSGAGLYELTNRLEHSDKPTICALFGTTLGGGLELAMSCHYRIALAGSRIGQPEVKLGLIPGAGGTQRLPRLCGLVRAARLCAFGEPISVEKALKWGIIDRLVDQDLQVAATEFALQVCNEGPRPTSKREDKLQFDSAVRAEIKEIRQQAVDKYQGAMASVHAVDAIEKAGELSFEDGLAIENELFIKALGSDEARNLIHLFFAERQACKVPEIESQESWQKAEQVGFPGLFTDDVGLLEALIRSDIPLKMVDPARLAETTVSFLFLREIPTEAIRNSVSPTAKTKDPTTVIVSTSETFYPDKIAGLGWDPSRIIGLRFWPGEPGFAEIGVGESTDAFALRSLVELLKRLRCSFVVEKPAPYYASTRIREHRFDKSDLTIEVWKLLQEKNIARASDVDLIQIHCFGQPRHKADVGINGSP